MVQPSIKNGTRYNLRGQETSEERDAPSFDNEFMEVSSSCSEDSCSEDTTCSAGSTKPASPSPPKVVANKGANHMRILAEAVQKLKQRNEKLIQEKEELRRENVELRSKISSNAGNEEEPVAATNVSEDDALEDGVEASKNELTSAESEAIDELNKHSQSQDGISASQTVLTNQSSAKSENDALEEEAEASEDELTSASKYSQVPFGTSQSGFSDQSLASESSESDFLAVSASASITEYNTEQAREISDLHKTLEENNAILSHMSSRVSALTEMDGHNQRAIGLLHAKIAEQEDSKQRIVGAKQDVLDQLESKRVGVIELEKKLKAAIGDHGEDIRRSKDLEISLADRAFLAAELRRELVAAQEEKTKMIERREQDVHAMVKHRMVHVERRIFLDAEASMREVQRKEMDAMAVELLAVEEKAKEMRQKLSDGTFENKYQHVATDSSNTESESDSPQIVESISSSSSDNSEEMIDPWYTQYREENKERILKTSLSQEVPRMSELVHNLNELKSALAFSEKINKMTVSAIKEKVILAHTKVEKIKKVYEIVPHQLVGLSKTTVASQVTSIASSTSDVVEFTSLSQEWEAYYDEKKQAQEAVRTTLEKEAAHFAHAIRKNTFLCGGFLDKDSEDSEE
jgi:hypothetical protein